MKIEYVFSQILFDEREKRELNQKKMAKFLGISESNFAGYERGYNIPGIARAEAILNKLGYEIKIVKQGAEDDK